MASPLFSPAHPVDQSFLEARSKLLDIAAFLDRAERAGVSDDYRVQALLLALRELGSTGSDRARRILEKLSDSSSTPIAQAGNKSASGAPAPSQL